MQQMLVTKPTPFSHFFFIAVLLKVTFIDTKDSLEWSFPYILLNLSLNYN